MEESAVRSSVQAVGDALIAGDVDTAIGYLSDELQRNPGEVIAMLPLPATESSIVSLERTTSAVVVVMHVVGETSEVELQTRWKDRDGVPTLVEASHVSRTERLAAEAGAEALEGEPAGVEG